ncbi:MAG: CRISPR-associated endonuclease Cas1 [Melioribacteraceae bacterium]|nr:MAG: CRISPR-associated endonuclease Cas1 [Melioribacteraceae bacterium]
MCLLIVNQQGIKIRRDSNRFVFFNREEKKINEIPARVLKGILLFGNIQLTTQALTLVSDSGIALTYFTLQGRIKGHFHPVYKNNLDVKFSQYEIITNKAINLAYAKNIVIKKGEEYLRFIPVYGKNNAEVDSEGFRRTIKTGVQHANNAASIPELLGIEGSMSAAYFREYAKLFKGALQFVKRSRRPPENEVNSLLGFSYSIFYNLLFSVSLSTGFDPYMGFLHQPSYNRASLCLDILEFYRASIDKLVVKMTNQKSITADCFEYDEEKGFLLNELGYRKFFETWNPFINGDDKTKGIINSVTSTFEKLIRDVRAKQLPTF